MTDTPVTAASPLRARRCLFSLLIARLIVWANDVKGWRLAYDEGRIINPRPVRIGKATQPAEDAKHIRGSFHYSGLAVDLNLYDDLDGDGEDDDYVADGDDPRWRELARQWESLHPLCVSGRRWRDGNHLSFGEGSKASPLP